MLGRDVVDLHYRSLQSSTVHVCFDPPKDVSITACARQVDDGWEREKESDITATVKSSKDDEDGWRKKPHTTPLNPWFKSCVSWKEDDVFAPTSHASHAGPGAVPFQVRKPVESFPGTASSIGRSIGSSKLFQTKCPLELSLVNVFGRCLPISPGVTSFLSIAVQQKHPGCSR